MSITGQRKLVGTTKRVVVIAALGLLSALTLASPRAYADAPVLQSVTVPSNQNHPTFRWTLPSSDKGTVRSEFAQTARQSDVNVDGYFLQKNLVSFNTLTQTATSFTDEFEYRPGTYYVHIAGHDPKCIGGVCSQLQFSNVLSFDIVLPPTGGGGGGGGGGGADKVAPLQSLSFASVQDIDRLSVTVRSSETGTVRATASVSVPGASKVYRFKRVNRSIVANAKVKMRLKLAKKRLLAVKRALKRKKRLVAKVAVTVSDRAHNKRTHKAKIRLKN